MSDDASDFDRPLFKILAHNDTGQAVGHQAGVLIPKAMDSFFPQLSRLIGPGNPTVSENVTAALFDGSVFLEEVETRYQYQTWGGTRSPERRLTGQLTSLRNLARAGDILLMQRGIYDPARYKLTLVRQGTVGFAQIVPLIGYRRYGPLSENALPVAEPEVENELDRQEARELGQFDIFDADAELVETRTKKIARSRAFQIKVAQIYERTCAFCGLGFTRPDGRSETHAAHIVPRGLRGPDDARNGLLLCQSHHWAFDYGLIGVGADRRILVPAQILALPLNAELFQINGNVVRQPIVAHLAPADAALEWHRNNVLIR